jgi:hypothetical protein
MASFDWRSADAPDLSEQDKLIRRAFRGSGGYAALRGEIIKYLMSSETKQIRTVAQLLAARD